MLIIDVPVPYLPLLLLGRMRMIVRPTAFSAHWMFTAPNATTFPRCRATSARCLGVGRGIVQQRRIGIDRNTRNRDDGAGLQRDAVPGVQRAVGHQEVHATVLGVA